MCEMTEIMEYQSNVEDRILQNWIATQILTKDAPFLDPK